MPTTTCANCEQDVSNAAFCSSCGQRMKLVPMRLRDIATAVWSNLSSLEGPTFLTVRGLLVAPGRIARGWLDGKRTRYLHPVKFLFLVSLIIALSYEPLMAMRYSMQVPGSAIYTVGLESQSPMFSLFGIILPLPFAVAASLLGRPLRLRLAWIDWYVLGAYATGMGALLQMLFKLLALPLPQAWNAWLSIAEFALPIALVVWGAYHLAPRDRRWQAVLVALVLPIICGTTVVALIALFE